MNFKLDTVKNARSLSGIKTKNLEVNNLLFRSGRLDNLTTKDVETLERFNIKTVVDLRTITEQKERPDVLPVSIVHIPNPVLNEETMGITRDDKSRIDIITLIKEEAVDSEYAKRYMENTYLCLVKDEFALTAYKHLFDILLYSDGGVLWHCSAGKDRAGVASMYVLLALGASKEDIIANYLETNALLEEENSFVIENVMNRHGEFIANQIKDIFYCDSDYIEMIFSYIENNYSSMDQFLEVALGLTKAKLDILQRKYCRKV